MFLVLSVAPRENNKAGRDWWGPRVGAARSRGGTRRSARHSLSHKRDNDRDGKGLGADGDERFPFKEHEKEQFYHTCEERLVRGGR